jgi:uncharacterized protein YecE (DUF72 family)
MLAAYAERLSTVEIDATFYRPPDPDTLAGWYRTVPPGYLFALKAPREVTHERRLAGIADAVRTFYLAAAELEEKLGAVLFQLPPTLAKDLSLIRDLLALVPPPRARALGGAYPRAAEAFVATSPRRVRCSPRRWRAWCDPVAEAR